MAISGAQPENIKGIKVNRCSGGSGSCLEVESRDLSSNLVAGSEFIRIARAITEKTTDKLMITYTVEMTTTSCEADLLNELVDMTSGAQFDENLRTAAKKHTAVDLYPVQTGAAVAVSKIRSNNNKNKTLLISRNLRIEEEIALLNESPSVSLRETAGQVGVIAGIVAVTSLLVCVVIYISFMARYKKASMLYKNDNTTICSSSGSNSSVNQLACIV